jgi:hypothetical protein
MARQNGQLPYPHQLQPLLFGQFPPLPHPRTLPPERVPNHRRAELAEVVKKLIKAVGQQNQFTHGRTLCFVIPKVNLPNVFA